MRRSDLLVRTLLLVVPLVAGCSEEQGQPGGGPLRSASVSECGGFAPADAAPQGGATYCDAEVLSWEHDAAGSLTLVDERALLNCCGDHSVVAGINGATVIVQEVDEPQDGSTRCRCMCVFDFSATLDLDVLGDELVHLRLERLVTDSGEGPRVVFEGDLDLAEGSGSVIVDETDATGFCP